MHSGSLPELSEQDETGAESEEDEQSEHVEIDASKEAVMLDESEQKGSDSAERLNDVQKAERDISNAGLSSYIIFNGFIVFTISALRI